LYLFAERQASNDELFNSADIDGDEQTDGLTGLSRPIYVHAISLNYVQTMPKLRQTLLAMSPLNLPNPRITLQSSRTRMSRVLPAMTMLMKTLKTQS